MPRQWKITDKIIADIEVLLRLQQKLSVETGQVVISMKFFNNISSQMANTKTRNYLDSVVHAMQATYGNCFILLAAVLIHLAN